MKDTSFLRKIFKMFSYQQPLDHLSNLFEYIPRRIDFQNIVEIVLVDFKNHIEILPMVGFQFSLKLLMYDFQFTITYIKSMHRLKDTSFLRKIFKP